MTNTTATCPQDDTLLKLSNGLLTADQEVVVSTHLDTCPDCQKIFNRIANLDQFIDRVADALGDSGDLTLLEEHVPPVKPSGDTDLQDEDTIAEHVDQPSHPLSPIADVEK